MKLAKKNDQAVLSFEISGLTRVGRRVHVVHDVRIDVMRPGDVDKLSEPLCPEPDVSQLSIDERNIFDVFFSRSYFARFT